MKKLISTELTAANIDTVRGLLAGVPDRLEALGRPLSRQQLHRPLGPGARSFIEVVAHLVHLEARSSEAIYLALLLDEPLLAAVHPERHLGRLLRFDLLPFSDLLVYFRVRRTILLRVLDGLAEEQWARVIREAGKKRRESVYWRARTIALHEQEHLSELEQRAGSF